MAPFSPVSVSVSVLGWREDGLRQGGVGSSHSRHQPVATSQPFPLLRPASRQACDPHGNGHPPLPPTGCPLRIWVPRVGAMHRRRCVDLVLRFDFDGAWQRVCAIDSICRFQRALLPNALPEVATLDIVRTPVSGPSAITSRTMSKVARPPNAPASLRVGGGLRFSFFDLESGSGGRGCSLLLVSGRAGETENSKFKIEN